MRRRLAFSRVLAVDAARAASAMFTAPASAQRRAITDKDLFSFVWVVDPQISPEGSRYRLGDFGEPVARTRDQG